jgi:hypothetical protein
MIKWKDEKEGYELEIIRSFCAKVTGFIKVKFEKKNE